MSETISVARIVPRTVAEGPGMRTALWVQGCSVRCDGCFNPQFWTPHGGTATSVSDLVDIVLEAGTEGVTLLGGEPFDQASPLAELGLALRDLGRTVMTFTGFVLEDLRERAADDADIASLLFVTDLLVDGPYLVDQPDLVRPWVGSTNQRFHALTPRYAHVAANPEQHPDRLEIVVEADGTTRINGWAPVEALESLLDDIGPAPAALRVRR